MSRQDKRAIRCCLVTVSDISICDSNLALCYYTAHMPRAHTLLTSLMPMPRPLLSESWCFSQLPDRNSHRRGPMHIYRQFSG